jgi:hypothetical protein
VRAPSTMNASDMEVSSRADDGIRHGC